MSDLANQTPASTYKGLLQVNDYTNGVDGTSKFVQDGEGTDSALSVSTTKVGVGTASPTQELDVSGNVVADEYALDQTGSSSSAVAIHAPATNELAIRTNSTEAMRIDSSGNVEVNGQIISNRRFMSENSLEIVSDYNDVGASSAIIFKIDGQGGDNEVMRIDSDGNVGIGTNSPASPLEVASTTGGVIMPRMTTTQMNAISSPTDGEMIYNTTENKFYGRANGAWTALH